MERRRPIIRNATTGDVHQINSLVHRGSDSGTLRPRTKEEIRRKFGNFVVAENGSLVGCASLEVYTPHIGEIRSLYVLPFYRGEGLATEMILFLLDRPNVPERVVAISTTPDVFKRKGFGNMQAGREITFI